MGDTIQVEGMATLTIRMGHYSLRSIAKVDFLIVRAPSTYNAILEQLGLNTLRAVVSTYYLKIKFLAVHGVGEIHEDQSLAHHYYHIALHGAKACGAYQVEGLDTHIDLAKQ